MSRSPAGTRAKSFTVANSGSDDNNDSNNYNFYLAHSNNLQKGKLMYNYNNKGIAWKRTGLGVQILIGTF